MEITVEKVSTMGCRIINAYPCMYRALGNDSWVNFTVVVSRPPDSRSKIQEHHANGDLIPFYVMLSFFWLYAYDIIIVISKA